MKYLAKYFSYLSLIACILALLSADAYACGGCSGEAGWQPRHQFESTVN